MVVSEIGVELVSVSVYESVLEEIAFRAIPGARAADGLSVEF